MKLPPPAARPGCSRAGAGAAPPLRATMGCQHLTLLLLCEFLFQFGYPLLKAIHLLLEGFPLVLDDAPRLRFAPHYLCIRIIQLSLKISDSRLPSQHFSITRDISFLRCGGGSLELRSEQGDLTLLPSDLGLAG